VTSTAGKPNDPLFSLQWNFRDNGSAAGQSAGGADDARRGDAEQFH